MDITNTAIMAAIAAGVMVGILTSVQGPLFAMVGQRLGVFESAFVASLGGMIATAIPILWLRGGNLGEWRSVPWYALVAGTMGVAVLVGINIIIPRLGAITTTIVIIVVQLVINSVLDSQGWLGLQQRPFTLTRIFGILVLMVGVWLVVRE